MIYVTTESGEPTVDDFRDALADHRMPSDPETMLRLDLIGFEGREADDTLVWSVPFTTAGRIAYADAWGDE